MTMKFRLGFESLLQIESPEIVPIEYFKLRVAEKNSSPPRKRQLKFCSEMQIYNGSNSFHPGPPSLSSNQLSCCFHVLPQL